MNLSELIQIDNRFEKSVNLLLDLHSQEKVDNYIPTHSSVNILKDYIGTVLRYSGNRASVLVGPYGKGKSHLLLILLTILSQDKNVNITALIERIRAVNPKVAEDIQAVANNQGPMLPVIINSNGGSLGQDLLRALVKALNAAGMNDIVPDSYFTEAVKSIRQWRTDFPATYNAFAAGLDRPVDKFIRALKRFDEGALAQFKTIYPTLTSGSVFNPFVDDEAISIYRSVNRCLREQYQYSGIFIVFDEFSKYIEGHSVDRFSEDMKMLQDMCELSNASKDEQLHLVCVAHKSIKSYGSALPESVLNAFKGVEGRLKETPFVVSSQNSYELISDAIQKTPAFYAWIRGSKEFVRIAQQSYEMKSFSALFAPNDYNTIVAEGCFPLTPVAANLLLALSEKIAQNERTVFTYITSKDRDGLTQAIAGCKEPTFIGATSIYDYFELLFKDEIQSSIHHEWLEAEYALTMTNQKAEQDIIKAIAIIHMVNKPDELIASDKYLRLASGLSEASYSVGISGLVDKKLVELRSRTSAYEFKNNIGVDVEEAISDCAAKRFFKADVGSVLCNAYQVKSILPKKHNQDYRMTRYFNVTFMGLNQFLALKNTAYLEWSNEPDGVVIFLLPEQGLDEVVVENHTKEIQGEGVIVCLPRRQVGCDELVKKLLAVRYLASDTTFIDENQALKRELHNIEEDYVLELNSWVVKTYFPLQSVYTIKGERTTGAMGLNRLVSDLCDELYNLTPVINNELINRHFVIGQIAKAKNNIMEEMLGTNNTDQYKSGTSSEATIFRAVFQNNSTDAGMAQVRREVQAFIQKSEDQKLPVCDLVSTLIAPPYGMRKGPMPLILLDAILKQHGMPVISLGNKEVVLNADVVNNMIRSPADYYLQIEKETAQVGRYLSDMIDLFSDFIEYCREVDEHNQMAKLICVMQSWYRSLPQTSMTFTIPDKKGQNMTQLIAFRKIFSSPYLNPRQILFDKIPNAFGSESLDDTFKAVQGARVAIDSHIHLVREQAVTALRDAFGLASDINLGRNLNAWYEELPASAKNSVVAMSTENITRAIINIKTSDEELIAANLLYAVTGTFIEDLKENTLDQFRMGLKQYIQDMEKMSEETAHANKLTFLEDGKQVERFYSYKQDKISTTATFFKNALGDILEEYDTLEDNEKIGVLMDMVKELMRREQ